MKFTFSTDYKVDDQNGRDVQCSYNVALAAFNAQVFDDSAQGNAEEQFLAELGVTGVDEARDLVYKICAEAQKETEKL